MSSSNSRIPVDNIPSTILPSLCLYQWRWSTATVAPGSTSLYAATHSPAQQLAALYGIPKDRIHTFTSYKKFKEDLQQCEDDFFSGAGKQYLAFGDVQQSSVRPIERGRSRSELPAFRLLYDTTEEVLIIKLMPGLHHNLAAEDFVEMFKDKVASLGINRNSLRNIGPTRCGAPGARSKEPDATLRPLTRVLATDWPSVVIEVGVSESLSQLRTDARFWLTRSGGQTRIVILLAVKKATRVMKIERWEDMSRTRLTRRSSPRYNPTKMQALTLQASGQLSGGPLLIPASKVYDTLPPGLGQDDFTFTGQDLAQYIQEYWGRLG